MEETFLRVKSERDELIKRKNRDSTDGSGKAINDGQSDEIANLKVELSRQKAYEAQFIEYVSRRNEDNHKDLVVETFEVYWSVNGPFKCCVKFIHCKIV